jgi:4-carboxymuconolactone decarboxylase
MRTVNELNDRERELVALGAAIASNCFQCIEFHIPESRKAGLTDVQIKEAVHIADRVRRVPARAVLEAALARIKESPNPLAEAAGTGCGCTG